MSGETTFVRIYSIVNTESPPYCQKSCFPYDR